MSDSEDSLSSHNVSRTPPYAGVDVEEVEMTEDDTEADTVNSAVALQSHQLDTDADSDVRKAPLNTGSDATSKMVMNLYC